MVDRWTVERAVRSEECTLDPPGRQLVLTLLTWSDHDTAMIPERYTPSLTDLVKGTGLARSTVAAWLNKLEELGWVTRSRPSVADARRKKARTVYALAVPADLAKVLGRKTGPTRGPARPERGAAAGPGGGPAGSDSPRSAGPGGGPVKAGSGPARGLELVRSTDRVSPPDGLNPYREQETVGRRAANGDDDHAYVEGPNGRCALPGCNRSAPLHSRRLAVVSKRERRVIGE